MISSFGQNATLKTKRAHCAHLSVVLFNDRMVTNCPIDLLYIYSLTTKQDNVKRYAKVVKRLFKRIYGKKIFERKAKFALSLLHAGIEKSI